MKHGFMTFSYPKASLEALFEDARQFGYDGIEIRIGVNHGHGLEIDTPPAAQQAARKQAKEEGIELYSVASSFQLALRPLDDDEAKRTLALTSEIGARVIRVFGGSFEDEGIQFDTARTQLVAGLSRFAELARQETDGGVVLALESHDSWTDPAVLVAVMEEVGQPGVGINWDAYHIVRMTGMGVAEHFPIIKRWVNHVHVHDGTDTKQAPVLSPIGTGIVDHDALIRCLASINFDGYLMGEWIHSVMEGNTDPIVYLPRELKKLRKIEASLA